MQQVVLYGLWWTLSHLHKSVEITLNTEIMESSEWGGDCFCHNYV